MRIACVCKYLCERNKEPSVELLLDIGECVSILVEVSGDENEVFLLWLEVKVV